MSEHQIVPAVRPLLEDIADEHREMVVTRSVRPAKDMARALERAGVPFGVGVRLVARAASMSLAAAIFGECEPATWEARLDEEVDRIKRDLRFHFLDFGAPK